ncbi:MAG: hypothetical protein LBK95_15525 [Bifidobacteriaceae bacterium]|jgi:hypothetical protein|nr:hypothetical protein [Bifidobacteriaceae bacterium]
MAMFFLGVVGLIAVFVGPLLYYTVMKTYRLDGRDDAKDQVVGSWYHVRRANEEPGDHTAEIAQRYLAWGSPVFVKYLSRFEGVDVRSEFSDRPPKPRWADIVQMGRSDQPTPVAMWAEDRPKPQG